MPGSPSLFIEGWKTFLAPLGQDKDAAEVLNTLEFGYTLDLVNPLSPAQVESPGYQHRTAILRRILLAALGKEQTDVVEGILSDSSPTPPSFHLPNFKSAEQHPAVVSEKLQKLLQCGTIAEWTPEMGRPHLVNSLGVVLKDAEARLVMGPMLLNRWQNRRPVSYENLSLVEAFLQPGDFMIKDDAKAGYHHIPIAPECWKYLVVAWQGKYYYFRFLPFGLATACHVYTQFQLVANRVLRIYGAEMMQYIDDALHAARSEYAARYRSYVRLLMGSALGIYFSDKSIFSPTRQLSILGMDVTTVATDPEFPGQYFVCFSVPQKRLDKLQAAATKLFSAAVPTKRQIAAVAGLLLSCKTGAPLSPLFVRSLYDNLKTGNDWDQSVVLTAAAVADLRWVVDSMPKYNGRKLKKPLRQHGLLIDVDSSDFSHAARVFNLETGAHLGDLIAQFPPELQGSSSLLREATGIHQLASQAFAQFSKSLMHSYLRIHIRNDNQGAVSNFQKMKAGSLELLSPVHNFYNLCMEHDVQATFEWLPRTTAEIQAVDGLSKLTDTTDFYIPKKILYEIVKRDFPLNNSLAVHAAQQLQRSSWGSPTVDVLASASNKKAPIFFSKGHDVGAAAVDGYSQPWPVYQGGIRQLYWIFAGPVSDQQLAIRKLMEEKCDAIFIVPSRSRQPWVGSFFQLPIIDSISFEYSAGLYVAGPSAPPEWKAKPPHIPLTAHFVSWLS